LYELKKSGPNERVFAPLSIDAVGMKGRTRVPAAIAYLMSKVRSPSVG